MSRSIRVELAEGGAVGSRAFVTTKFLFFKLDTEVFVCIRNGGGLASAEWVSESTGKHASFLDLGCEINEAAQAAVFHLKLAPIWQEISTVSERMRKGGAA